MIGLLIIGEGALQYQLIYVSTCMITLNYSEIVKIGFLVVNFKQFFSVQIFIEMCQTLTEAD